MAYRMVTCLHALGDLELPKKTSGTIICGQMVTVKAPPFSTWGNIEWIKLHYVTVRIKIKYTRRIAKVKLKSIHCNLNICGNRIS